MSKEAPGQRGTLLRGALDLLVLRVLSHGPEHGFGIAKLLGQLSKDWLQLDEGSLYPCLYRMEERGWVKSSISVSENNRRARYYELTRKGNEELRRQTQNWREFSNVVDLCWSDKWRSQSGDPHLRRGGAAGEDLRRNGRFIARPRSRNSKRWVIAAGARRRRSGGEWV